MIFEPFQHIPLSDLLWKDSVKDGCSQGIQGLD